MNKDAPVLQVANLLLKTIRYDILHLSIEDKADIAGVQVMIDTSDIDHIFRILFSFASRNMYAV